MPFLQEKKGVTNFERQTWDRELYEKRAQLRASGQLEEKEKEEFKAAEEGAQGPAGSARAFLKARSQKVTLDNNVGTVRVVKSDDMNKNGGYYCEVCECGLKDSVAYLDHINGKKRYSMRVERSTVDQVKNRLQSAAKRKWDPIVTKKLDAMEEYEKKLKAVEEEEARVKKQKKEDKKAKKHAQTSDLPSSTTTTDAASATDANKPPAEDPEAAATDDADAEMMAMMGFGGFGSSKNSYCTTESSLHVDVLGSDSSPVVLKAVRLLHPQNGSVYEAGAPLEFRFALTVSNPDRFLREYSDSMTTCVEFSQGDRQRCKRLPLLFDDLSQGWHSARISLYDGIDNAFWIRSEGVTFSVLSEEAIEDQLTEKKALERKRFGIQEDVDLLTWSRRNQPPKHDDATTLVLENRSSETRTPEPTNRISFPSSPILVVGIKSSSFSGFPQRQAIRDTWANRVTSLLRRDVRIMFLCCRPQALDLDPSIAQEVMAALEREKQGYGDLLTDEMDCDDSYLELADKVKEFLHYVVTSFELHTARYIVITDDDIYLRVEDLVSTLLRQGDNATRFYGGQVWSEQFVYPERDPRHRHFLSLGHYPMPKPPPFAHSPHYLMSINCARYIAKNHKRLQSLRGMDDISIALWLLTMQVHPQHIPHFANLRGSYPHKCDDAFTSFADLSASAIRIIHSNRQRGLPLCTDFDAFTWGKPSKHPQWMISREGREATSAHGGAGCKQLRVTFSYFPMTEQFEAYCARIASSMQRTEPPQLLNERGIDTIVAQFRRHMVTMAKQALHSAWQRTDDATTASERQQHQETQLMQWMQSLRTAVGSRN
ncbi:Zinc finger matrin-type protein 2, partial [Globisporangium splendens]